jgi:hypothetical protein
MLLPELWHWIQKVAPPQHVIRASGGFRGIVAAEPAVIEGFPKIVQAHVVLYADTLV